MQIYGDGVEVGGGPGGPRGRGRTLGGPTLMDRFWAPGADSFTSIFLNFEKLLCGFSGHFENFYFCTKISPW